MQMSFERQWANLKKHESRAKTYARTFDIVLTQGRGSRVWDQQGRSYIDCLSCAGALPLGHNHPFVKQRVREFLDSDAIQQGLDLATPAKIEFVDLLLRTLPDPFTKNARVQFCGPTGSDAVEAAIKLLKTATGRRSVLAFHGAYHGQTLGALSLMGKVDPKLSIAGLMPEVQFLPYPNAYRCPFGVGGRDSERLSLTYVANLLADPESGITPPAALIVEAVQGEGGCIPASDTWLQGLREITLMHGIPLVIDEVQTGLYRTGDRFAFEASGIVPDAVVLSKAIGGGYPLSVLVYHERYDRWQAGAHSGTFRGNQIAFAAGAATMTYMVEQQMGSHVERVGTLLREGLSALQARHPCIGDVRGRGLMLGLEIVNPGRCSSYANAPAADGALAARIRSLCLQNGLIIETGGRHGAVLRLLPPLILDESEVSEVLDILSLALDQCQPMIDKT